MPHNLTKRHENSVEILKKKKRSFMYFPVKEEKKKKIVR